VVVQDRLPLEGLNVSAVLLSRKTGVSQLVPLTWNGSSYSGVIAGMLQPGISNLTVTVAHPGSNVWYAQGENNLPAALRTQYPAFATRVQSQEIWVPGAQNTKSLPGLEAWTAISENRSNVTALKLFIKNGDNRSVDRTSCTLLLQLDRSSRSASRVLGVLPCWRIEGESRVG
jgi:hypothetical protein